MLDGGTYFKDENAEKILSLIKDEVMNYPAFIIEKQVESGPIYQIIKQN